MVQKLNVKPLPLSSISACTDNDSQWLVAEMQMDFL